jgi:hypothetical protein
MECVGRHSCVGRTKNIKFIFYYRLKKTLGYILQPGGRRKMQHVSLSPMPAEK